MSDVESKLDLRQEFMAKVDGVVGIDLWSSRYEYVLRRAVGRNPALLPQSGGVHIVTLTDGVLIFYRIVGGDTIRPVDIMRQYRARRLALPPSTRLIGRYRYNPCSAVYAATASGTR